MDEPFRPVPTSVRYSIACRARHRCGRAVALVLSSVACTAIAHAHESPAAPPQFAAADCIIVVDPAEQSALDIAYEVAADDTALEQGDIAVPDAKTHQFFAFRGMVFAQGFLHELRAFDAEMSEPILLPLWITSDDVKRAAQANELAPAANFSQSDVPDVAVLERHPELEGRWLRITADDARVPITVARAREGVRWELAGVAPGLYTIAAYIFSPPFNGWAARPGLVKVVDGASDLPAAVIDPVHELVFSYQGKRVRACVDVPQGSTLSADFLVEERPEQGFLPWLDPRPIEGDSLELCFHHPRPELTGSVRLRFELESPAGTRTTIYSPDTITALQGHGECTPSESICCDAAERAPPEGCAGAGDDACQAREDAGVTPGASEAQPDAGAHAAGDGGEGGGCAIAAHAPGEPPFCLAAAPLLCAWLAVRRVRRGLGRQDRPGRPRSSDGAGIPDRTRHA